MSHWWSIKSPDNGILADFWLLEESSISIPLKMAVIMCNLIFLKYQYFINEINFIN